MANTKNFVGVLLIFSPIVTIGIGAALGFYPYYTFLGAISIFSIFGIIYPAVGYFLSVYIKSKLTAKMAAQSTLTLFILLGLVNAFIIYFSLPMGVVYQGESITYGFSAISIVCHIYFFFVIKKILATQPPENHWKAHGLFWFWLSALAFPWLGEMP